MKINGKEINIFEDGNEEILANLANIYFEVKRQLRDNKIKLPYHEGSFKKVFGKNHKIEVSIDEMIELRDYFDNYYSEDVQNKIMNDFSAGMGYVDPKNIDNGFKNNTLHNFR